MTDGKINPGNAPHSGFAAASGERLSFIWTAFAASTGCLLTRRGPHDDNRLLALCRIIGAVGAGCLLEFLADEHSPLDLPGDDGIIIVEAPDRLPDDIKFVLNLAGYERDFNLPGRDAKDVGYVFSGVTRDTQRRPVLWVTGTTPIGLLLAARWLTAESLSGMPCPISYPRAPFESVITPAPPYSKAASGSLCLTFLNSVVVCGEEEYDVNVGEWRARAPKILVRLRYTGTELTSMTVDGKELSRGDMFDLVRVLAIAASESRWVTMLEAQRSIDGNGYSEQGISDRVKTLRARLTDIRELRNDSVVVLSRRRVDRFEYQLNAKVEVFKKG